MVSFWWNFNEMFLFQEFIYLFIYYVREEAIQAISPWASQYKLAFPQKLSVGEFKNSFEFTIFVTRPPAFQKAAIMAVTFWPWKGQFLLWRGSVFLPEEGMLQRTAPNDTDTHLEYAYFIDASDASITTLLYFWSAYILLK